MLRSIRARQVFLLQLTQLQYQSGAVIITLLLVVMHQVLHLTQLHLIQLRLMLVIQTVRQCTSNIVQMAAAHGLPIPVAVLQLDQLPVVLPQVHHI